MRGSAALPDMVTKVVTYSLAPPVIAAGLLLLASMVADDERATVELLPMTAIVVVDVRSEITNSRTGGYNLLAGPESNSDARPTR